MRLFLALLALGVVAIASLMLAPMKAIMPPRLHMAPLAFAR